jgi:FtsP/CotA-like multicopper oxidase with cupredoxin domain
MKHAPYRLKIMAATMSAAISQQAPAGPGTVCNDDPNNPVAPAINCTNVVKTYFANSPLLTKFVDSLPGLTPAGVNNLGQYLPVAAMDTASYPGSDYMEMAAVDYTEKMHSELQKATLLRGYVQIDRSATDAGTPGTASTNPLALHYPDGSPIWIAKEIGVVNGRWDHTLAKDANGQAILVHAIAKDKPHYLGPIILAQKDKATRVKFDNLVKAGSAVLDANGKVQPDQAGNPLRNGDLFIPTDHTLAGTDFIPAPGGGFSTTLFRENRAELHLHGGSTPWISDGTPHQYIMPAGDEILFKKDPANGGLGLPDYARGSSTVNVPDMPDPGLGSTTYYWTNADSGRLMMYHDHTSGTTRLNAYVGEAAGYLIHEAAENGLMQQVLGTNDYVAAEGIPLVIQDKSFVPADIAAQDALWDQNAWGQPGDLWFPHVYEPATFADGTANPAGRWDLGVSTWPPVNLPAGLKLPAGGYGDATHVPEAFMDTALVNGTAYPYLTVEPKAYRFRVLSVGNDRAFNLGIYVAADKNTVDLALADPYANAALCDANSAPSNCTEVKMVPFDATQRTFPAYWGTPDIYPDGNGGVVDNTPMGLHLGGVPDPATAGPMMYQIGTEGGMFDHVVEIPSTVTNYENMTDINNPANPNLPLLVVKEHGLHLAPAERADVVIDFSQYAGKTLILYNDAPAPSPGPDSRYDYFTGDADQTSMGGAPTTLPGKGPNTRTVMQIRVAPAAPGTTPAPFAVYDAATGALDPTSGLAKLKAGLPGVVAATQDPLLTRLRLRPTRHGGGLRGAGVVG